MDLSWRRSKSTLGPFGTLYFKTKAKGPVSKMEPVVGDQSGSGEKSAQSKDSSVKKAQRLLRIFGTKLPDRVWNGTDGQGRWLLQL